MTEERKFCRICKNLGIDCEAGIFYCSLSHRPDKLPNTLKCDEFILCDFIARLEQENKELKAEIDDLLEKKPDCNDEFGCQELIELKQENKELREMLSKEPKAMQAFQIAYSGNKKENETLWGMVKDYRSALEEIKKLINIKIECLQYEIKHDCFSEIRCKALNEQIEFLDKINEVLNVKY